MKSRSIWSYEASDMNSDLSNKYFPWFHLTSDYKYKISGKKKKDYKILLKPFYKLRIKRVFFEIKIRFWNIDQKVEN